MAGGIPAGIYTSNLREACLYISEHSQAEVIIVEDNKQLSKFIETGHRLPALKAFVVWAEPVDQTIAKKCTATVYSFDEFLNLGAGNVFKYSFTFIVVYTFCSHSCPTVRCR